MSETIAGYSALEGLLKPGTYGAEGMAPGVSIEQRPHVTQYQLIARNNKAAQLANRLSRFLGKKRALAPMAAAERNGLFVCATGPRDYWILAEGSAGSDAPGVLDGIADNCASLFDQSEGRVVVRLSGPNAAVALAMGTPLDLLGPAFPAEGASHTVIEHIPVLVAWRAKPVCYDISLPRSYAASFITWLRETARDFGYVIETPTTL